MSPGRRDNDAGPGRRGSVVSRVITEHLQHTQTENAAGGRQEQQKHEHAKRKFQDSERPYDIILQHDRSRKCIGPQSQMCINTEYDTDCSDQNQNTNTENSGIDEARPPERPLSHS
ncbi:hypothetical protein PR048_001399 [Dryococelus australis]|uniref:Uncharacterized protein n=1 Tax=Dryococelus australis TaxID=614101 RepID=A0ABQ9IH85_9NEOP|nr:hypothetical protein PR048_001399 [Dryococelus australis]